METITDYNNTKIHLNTFQNLLIMKFDKEVRIFSKNDFDELIEAVNKLTNEGNISND